MPEQPTQANTRNARTLGAAYWHVEQHEAHIDPLLDCLVALARIHGKQVSRQALIAGLPLVDNLLSPSLFHRAAARAGLSARMARSTLEDIAPSLYPVILLLKERGACLLLERTEDQQCRISFPESGESSELIKRAELAQQYEGVAIVARPVFRFQQRNIDIGKGSRGRHWFWGAVMQNWRLYRDTLAAAFLLNLFALVMPIFSMNVYDRVVPHQAEETLWVLSLGAIMVLGLEFILRNIRAYIIDTAGKRIDAVISALIMERVLGVRMSARPKSAGSFAANLRSFETVRDFFMSATITAIVDFPFSIIFVFVLFWLSPWFLIPPLITMAIMLLNAIFTKEKMSTLSEQSQRASAEKNATLIEVLVGLESIKSVSAESTYQRRWERATIFISQVGSRMRLISTLSTSLAQSLQQLCSILILIIGVYLIMKGEVSMGGIIAASMLSGRLLAPMGVIAGLLMQYEQAHAALASIDQLMKLPVEREDSSSFLHRPDIKGDIEFRNISFTYPGQEIEVLSGISLTVKAGEKIGIIGVIGSGKSTLEKLTLNLYQATEGAVLIDGIDVRQIDPVDLRRNIGYVPQDPQLVYGTLRENIALGAPFADDGQIVRAAELAGIAEYANAHPKGFDLVIEERGESLSGGQRQAIAIARALLSDPPILLLDEPSSSMDHQSEMRFKQNIASHCQNKTILVVTHRTSLLDLVDRLIVIDKGKIVADGPKSQVMEALQQGRIGRSA